MELRTQVSIPLADYTAGEHVFGPVVVSGRVDGVHVRLSRCTSAAPDLWVDSATTIEMFCEVQDPNPGSPWEMAGSVKGSGGILTYRGVESDETTLASWWDGNATDKRPARVRLRMVVSGGTARTEGNSKWYGLLPGEHPVR